MVAVGVDACKTGWIAVALGPDGSTRAHFLPRIGVLADAVPEAAGVGIDIPIGLPERGRRQADLEACAALGPCRNSLFFTPVRDALAAPTHALATAASVRLTGVGISQQSYALRHKIFEVETWLLDAPSPVWEVHPELSFTTLIGTPARAAKTTWAGMEERRRALASAGVEIASDQGEAGIRANVDDMLDAAVCAWSARRLVSGRGISRPSPPERGTDGREMAIWA